MANQSILAAFERMWVHLVDALSTKANTTDIDSLKEDIANCSQIQIITLEVDD